MWSGLDSSDYKNIQKKIPYVINFNLKKISSLDIRLAEIPKIKLKYLMLGGNVD